MCGRYAGSATRPELLERYAAEPAGPEVPPCYNVAPTTDVAVVRAVDGRRVLDTVRWGLVPPWAPSPDVGSRMINARLETIATKPAFRDAFATRRCLVPADGYYEWYAADGPTRLPHLVRPADDRPLAFGGILEAWRNPADPDAPPLRTVAIVTAPAADDIAYLHARMPLMVPPHRWDEWLDASLADPEALAWECAAQTAGTLDVVRVSRAVGDVRNDGPELLVAEPADEQTALF